MRLRFLPFSVLLAAVLLVAGCGGSGKLRYDSAKEAFDKGKTFYDKGKPQRAIPYFQAVFDYGRTHEWAADAQIFLARAYYLNKEYILAASEFSRFSEIYRTDPRRPDAEYERAMAYYELSPSYELDQTDTERAITQFQLFVQRFPDSPRVQEAEARVAELREKMAHKMFAAAAMYERQELYEAAALTYEGVFDVYPGSTWADDALVGAMRAYVSFAELSVPTRQAERYEHALENHRRLTQIFPDTPLKAEAEGHRARAAARLEVLKGAAEAPIAGQN